MRRFVATCYDDWLDKLTTIQLNLTMDNGFPAELRYGYGMYPYMHLYNSDEFPAPAFNVTIPNLYND